MKNIARVITNVRQHWVGDGFPVRSLFSYHEDAAVFDPFLLLDYAGPAEFAPTAKRRGVGEHPHRGFETVTIVFQGEVDHRDSAGNHGSVGPGDVQWMTAAAGVVHEELHSQRFTESGGKFEMVQLWVNLPADQKMSQPRYQEILSRTIPKVTLGSGATARVIAGQLAGASGPAHTVTPVELWDITLDAGAKASLPVPDGHTTVAVVQQGNVKVNGQRSVEGVSLVLFDRAGDAIELEAESGARVLLVAGQPLSEPIAAQGPFVMNTAQQIREAIVDYQEGRMGHLA